MKIVHSSAKPFLLPPHLSLAILRLPVRGASAAAGARLLLEVRSCSRQFGSPSPQRWRPAKQPDATVKLGLDSSANDRQ
jgi:hypothetical protein